MKIDKPRNQSKLDFRQVNSQDEEKSTQKNSINDALDSKENLTVSAIRSLKWVNAGQRMLAERRIKDLHKDAMPYIVAQQRVGSETLCLDGAVALKAISWGTEKIFSNEGVAWHCGRDVTTFHCIFPEKEDLHSMGTAHDLFKKGLNDGEIQSLIIINEYYEKKYDDDFENPVADIAEHEVSRAVFYLLCATGEILPKDKKTAESLWGPLTEKQRQGAIVNVMALSAGSRGSPFLEMALKLDFDPNQYASLLSKTPLQQAEENRNEKAYHLLLQYKKK